MTMTLLIVGLLVFVLVRRAPLLLIGLLMAYMATYVSGPALVGICMWAVIFCGGQGLWWYLRRPRWLRMRGVRS